MEKEKINDLILNPVTYTKNSERFINKLIASKPQQIVRYVLVLKSIMENQQETTIRKTFVIKIVKDGLLIGSYAFYLIICSVLLRYIKQQANLIQTDQNKYSSCTSQLINQKNNLIRICQEIIHWFGNKIEEYPYSEIQFSSAFKILDQRNCGEINMANLLFRISDGQKYDSNFMEQMLVFKQAKKSMANFIQEQMKSILENQISHFSIIQGLIETGDSFIIMSIVSSLAGRLALVLERNSLQSFKDLLILSQQLLELGQIEFLVFFQQQVLPLVQKALQKIKENKEQLASQTALHVQLQKCVLFWRFICRKSDLQFKSQCFNRVILSGEGGEITKFIKEVQLNTKLKMTNLNIIPTTNQQKKIYVFNHYRLQQQKNLKFFDTSKKEQMKIVKFDKSQQENFLQINFKNSALINQNQQNQIQSKQSCKKYQSKEKLQKQLSLISKKGEKENDISDDFVKESQLQQAKERSCSNLLMQSSGPFHQGIKNSIQSRISKKMKMKSKRIEQQQAKEQFKSYDQRKDTHVKRKDDSNGKNLNPTTDNSSSYRKNNNYINNAVTQFINYDQVVQSLNNQKLRQFNQSFNRNSKTSQASLGKSPKKPQFSFKRSQKTLSKKLPESQENIIIRQYQIVQAKINELKTLLEQQEANNLNRQLIECQQAKSYIQGDLSCFSQCFKVEILKNRYKEQQTKVKNSKQLELERELGKLVHKRQLLNYALKQIDCSKFNKDSRDAFKQLCQKNIELKKLLIKPCKLTIYQDGKIDQQIFNLPKKEVKFQQIEQKLRVFLVNKQCILHQDKFLKIGLKFSSKQTISKFKVYLHFKNDVKDFRYEIVPSNFFLNPSASSQIFGKSNLIPSNKQIKLTYVLQEYTQSNKLSQLKLFYNKNDKANKVILDIPISKQIQYNFKQRGEHIKIPSFGFRTSRFKFTTRLYQQGRNYLRETFRQGYFKDSANDQYILVQHNLKAHIFKLYFDDRQGVVCLAGQNYQKDAQIMSYVLSLVAKPITSYSKF